MTLPADAPDVTLVPNAGWDRRVRVFRRQSLVDVFAVVTERYVVLVDTLDSPAAAAALVASLREDLAGRCLLVVNTHADWDHAWGNAAFAGPAPIWPAPIIGHQRGRDRLLSLTAREELATARASEPARFGSVRLVPPTITLTSELTIDGGDLTLVLLPTPGHQPDHLAVWLPEPGLLLAGDAVEQPFPSVAGPAGVPAARASLARLAALAPRMLLACHAPGMTSPALIADNLAYFDELEQRCRLALADERRPTADGDLDAALIYPFEAAAGPDLPDEQRAFYRQVHQDNIRAMLDWLRNDAAS